MRALLLVVFLVATLVAASQATAHAQVQQGDWWSPFRIDRPLFNPEMFTTLIVEKIAGNPAITTWTRRVAVLLTAFLFLWNLYISLTHQSPSGVTDALVRAAIVGTILANLPFVAWVVVSFHRALSAIGITVFDALGGASAFDQALERLHQALQVAADGIAGMGLFDAFRFIFVTLFAVAITVLLLLFMIIAIAVYNFLLFGSYLALAVAVLLVPLSLACLASRSTQNFAFEWLQVVLHSALVAMLATAAAGIIVNVAIVDRITQYAEGILQAQGDFQKMLMAILGLKELVPVIVMLAVGIFTLLNVQGLASAFVGRVESVAGALAGLYFAARAVGRPAVAMAGSAAAWVGPHGVGGIPTFAAGWRWLASRPAAAASAVSAGVQAARYQTQRAAGWIATHGGPLGYALAERMGFDRTLPGPLSPEHYAALQEMQEASRRFYEQAEQDLRALGYESPASVAYSPAALVEAPAGPREPTDEDMPTEPHFQPDWPPRD